MLVSRTRDKGLSKLQSLAHFMRRGYLLERQLVDPLNLLGG